MDQEPASFSQEGYPRRSRMSLIDESVLTNHSDYFYLKSKGARKRYRQGFHIVTPMARGTRHILAMQALQQRSISPMAPSL